MLTRALGASRSFFGVAVVQHPGNELLAKLPGGEGRMGGCRLMACPKAHHITQNAKANLSGNATWDFRTWALVVRVQRPSIAMSV